MTAGLLGFNDYISFGSKSKIPTEAKSEYPQFFLGPQYNPAKPFSLNSKFETSNVGAKKNSDGKPELMGINPFDISYGEYGEGHNQGSHGGDPLGSTLPGQDYRDYGADSLLAWAKQNGIEPDKVSFKQRLDIARQNPRDDKVERYVDGQDIANLGSSAGTGLDDRDWFELMRMHGDQFIGVARANANGELSDTQARSQARELLISQIGDYTKEGITDGNLIGVLIGKGLSAQEYKNNPTEMRRYERYLSAKSGSYDWAAMEKELTTDGFSQEDLKFVERFTGIDRENANLFTENLFYESFSNIQKLKENLHYFKDKALGFNLIIACDYKRDHNGALHMNHGSQTGLAADDKNPTIVLSPRDDSDMKRMIFRLAFIPKDTSITGEDWLSRELSHEESSLISMLGSSNLTSQEKIERFNSYLENNGLEKNVGIANYMLKGHGWSGGIALFDNGSYSNGDKDIMALMGLAVSPLVDQARVHQQSCSTAVGGLESNVGVGNSVMNDFAPITTKIVSVGANDIHWNGQGEHYQHVSYIHGNLVNNGQITDKNIFASQGQRDLTESEEALLANEKIKRNSTTGITEFTN
jgi:hypothetical protein